jgi:hypothetical protein
VREVRRKWYRAVFAKPIPRKLWDYVFRWSSEVLQMTHVRSHRVDGGVPLEDVTGETVNISEYLDFGIYDRVWYHENAGLGVPKLGRWLGVSHNRGSLMSYYVLTENGDVVSRTTVAPMTTLEMGTDVNKQRMADYDKRIKDRFGDDNFPDEGGKPDPSDWADLYEHNEDFWQEFAKVYGDSKMMEADATPEIEDDTYLKMELALPRDGQEDMKFARVKKRTRDAEGNPIGTANSNPILDTRMFDVEFEDGYTDSLAANLIAENLYAQVDSEGNRHLFMKEIQGHRKTAKAIEKAMMPMIFRATATVRGSVRRRVGIFLSSGKTAAVRGRR